jgi:hypothetical protein
MKKKESGSLIVLFESRFAQDTKNTRLRTKKGILPAAPQSGICCASGAGPPNVPVRGFMGCANGSTNGALNSKTYWMYALQT